MSQQINVNIRMDKDIKNSADKLFSELGFNMTTAVNAFIRQALRERAIPFYIKAGDLTHKTVNRKASIDRGRKLGRVTDVSNAFIDFPVNEEVHKGKLDFWTVESESDGM